MNRAWKNYDHMVEECSVAKTKIIDTVFQCFMFAWKKLVGFFFANLWLMHILSLICTQIFIYIFVYQSNSFKHFVVTREKYILPYKF